MYFYRLNRITMINKIISLAIFAFIGAVSMTELSAQVEVKKTKIVIVEKDVDDNGKVIEKKVVLEGEDAEKYLSCLLYTSDAADE